MINVFVKKRREVALLIRLYLLTAILLLLPQAVLAQGRPDFAPGRYFVKFNKDITSNEIAEVRRAGAAVKHQFPGIRALSIQVSSDSAVQALQHNPHVVYVEAEPMRYASSLGSSQLVPSSFNGLYGLLNIHATDAHTAGFNGIGIKVGVADTGLDYTHPDIAPNYKGGIDTVSNDNNPWWNNDPEETHGTHVAGTIIAANNSTGVLGVAYNSELYHARVLGPNGGYTSDIMAGVQWLVQNAGCKVVNMSLSGRRKSSTEESFYNSMRSQGALIVCATGNDGKGSLNYPAGYASNIAVGAVDRDSAHASFSNSGSNLDVSAPGVSVLSSVPAGTGFEGLITTTGQTFSAFPLDFAGSTSGTTGLLVSCGIGNPGDFPAAATGNIALIQRGTLSFADKVTNAMDAGAIGVIIYNNEPGDFLGTLGSDGAWIPALSVSDTAGTALQGLTNTSVTMTNQISSWDLYDGTSMATPHVTGAIAVMWSKNPSLTPDDVESTLFSTCQDLGAAGYDTTFGYGLVNLLAALNNLGSGDPPPPPPPADGDLSVSVETVIVAGRKGSEAEITATVTDGTSAVANASVTITVETPTGRVYSGSGSTNASGELTLTFSPRKPDGEGTFNVSATASKSGYNDGTGSGSFVLP